jgi:hypothetical protein
MMVCKLYLLPIYYKEYRTKVTPKQGKNNMNECLEPFAAPYFWRVYKELEQQPRKPEDEKPQ